MTVLLTLAEAAAAQPSAHITAKLLYREYRAGRLNGGKLGGTVCTTEGDMDDWIASCLGKSSRPASTSAPADPPAGSSKTEITRSAQATAQSVAKMLQNCGTPWADTSPPEFGPRPPLLPRSQ